MYLGLGSFPSMSSTVMIVSGRKGRVISMESGVFIFWPTADVLASVAFVPSSFPTESGWLVMSSINISSCSWDCRGPIVSSWFVGVSGLRFEILFWSLELYPIYPCCVVGNSSSTFVELIYYGSKVVTSSSLTTISNYCILSLRLWPCRVTQKNCRDAPNLGGAIFI